jgi:hypothetical protein
MSEPLTTYHKNLRAALADQGSGGVYQWNAEVLNSALVTTVQTGFGPAGVSVDPGETALDPAPATPDARGWLIFQSALLLVGGRMPVGWKTRAMQVRVDPMERMTTVDYLQRQIKRLEQNGDPHGDHDSGAGGLRSAG